MAGKSSGQAMAEMEKLASQIPGVSVAWSGASYQERLATGQAPLLYAISLIVIFLCLAALYESWSIPLAVLLVVPLGLVGAILFVTLRGLENDVFLQIGLLTTMGLTSKNAILMNEFAERAEREGKRVLDAAIEAARIRLRPILMTSFAFIFGVFPLAVATGPGANGRIAIGTAVIGGMLRRRSLPCSISPSSTCWSAAECVTASSSFGSISAAAAARPRREARRRPSCDARRRLHLDGAEICPAGTGGARLLAGRRPLFRRGRGRASGAYLQAGLHRPAASDADRTGARQQPRSSHRSGEHRRRARAISNPAREPVPASRCIGGRDLSGNRSSGGSGTGSGPARADRFGSSGSSSGVRANYDLGVDVPSFEIDLFGRLRSLTDVELNRYFATEAGARATRLTLVGDIVNAWLDHAADSSLLRISTETATSAQKSVRLTRIRLEGGIAPRTDLDQAEQIMDAAQADLARERPTVAQDVNALAAARRRAGRSEPSVRFDR